MNKDCAMELSVVSIMGRQLVVLGVYRVSDVGLQVNRSLGPLGHKSKLFCSCKAAASLLQVKGFGESKHTRSFEAQILKSFLSEA